MSAFAFQMSQSGGSSLVRKDDRRLDASQQNREKEVRRLFLIQLVARTFDPEV